MWRTEVDRLHNYNCRSNLKTSPSSILVEARLLQLFNIKSFITPFTSWNTNPTLFWDTLYFGELKYYSCNK